MELRGVNRRGTEGVVLVKIEKDTERGVNRHGIEGVLVKREQHTEKGQQTWNRGCCTGEEKTDVELKAWTVLVIKWIIIKYL